MKKLTEKISYLWYVNVIAPITTKIHTSFGQFLDDALDEMRAAELAGEEGAPPKGFGNPEYYSSDNQWPLDRVKAGHNQE